MAIDTDDGAPGPAGRAALRQGMDRSLWPPRPAARRQPPSWKRVPCSSGEDTHRQLAAAVDRADPSGTQIPPRDSEALVTLPAQAHLRDRDRRDLSSALDPRGDPRDPLRGVQAGLGSQLSPAGALRHRALCDKSAQVAAAYANAEGGQSLVGVDDDDTTTALGLSERDVAAFFEVPRRPDPVAPCRAVQP